MPGTVSNPPNRLHFFFFQSDPLLNFPARAEEGGFCSKEKGAVETGVKVLTAIAIELWLEIYGEFMEKKKNLFSHRFFNLTHTLNEECKPFEIENILKLPPGASELLPVPLELTMPPPESDD